MGIALISSGAEILPVLKGGSVDTYAYYLAKNLSKLNLQVSLYANKKSAIPNSTNLEFKPILFPETKFKKVNYFIFNFSVLYNLLKEKSSLEIVHTNLSTTTLLLSSFFRNIVFTSHSAYWWRSETTHKRQIEAVKRAKAAIAISKFIEKRMKFYKGENVFYVPNGVDIRLFRPAKHSFKKTLLTVCGISRQKGLVFLVKALKEVAKMHKDFKWVHVGTIPNEGDENFPYYLQIIKLIRKYNIGKYVNFLGRITLAKLIKIYQTSDVFVLPSLWEGMPLVVLEAMSCGLPIISTKIGGVEDLVIDNFNGTLVNPKDSAALANAILQLFDNRSLIKDMGKHSRKRVVKEFSWQVIARKIKEVYEQIL